MVDVKGWLKKDGLKKDGLDREKVGRTSKKQKTGKSVRMSVRRMYPSFIVLLVLIWALDQGKHRAIAGWVSTYASPPRPPYSVSENLSALEKNLEIFCCIEVCFA
jgi:hypothetical protein